MWRGGRSEKDVEGREEGEGCGGEGGVRRVWRGGKREKDVEGREEGEGCGEEGEGREGKNAQLKLTTF